MLVSHSRSQSGHIGMNLLATTGGWQLAVFLGASALLLIVPVLVLGWLWLESFVEGDSYRTSVRDVQRFAELRDAARREIWRRST